MEPEKVSHVTIAPQSGEVRIVVENPPAASDPPKRTTSLKDIGPTLVAALAIIGGFAGGVLDRNERLTEQSRSSELQDRKETRAQNLDLLKRLLAAIDACSRDSNGLVNLVGSPKSSEFSASLSRLRSEIQAVENIGVEARLTLPNLLVQDIEKTWKLLSAQVSNAQAAQGGGSDSAEAVKSLGPDFQRFLDQYKALLTDARAHLGV